MSKVPLAEAPVKSRTKAQRKPAEGTLNSKKPNPYELAYKIVWDKLPRWKQLAITEDIAAKNWDTRLYNEFAHDVAKTAEEMYVTAEEQLTAVEKN